MNTSRRPAVAGMFYPGDPVSLSSTVNEFLSNSSKESSSPVKFIVVPHAGYVYSGQIAADSFVEVDPDIYDRVFVLGPSHRHYFSGLAESGDQYWELPTGSAAIQQLNDTRVLTKSEYHSSEHCLEVQFPFLLELFKDVSFSPILVSGKHAAIMQHADLLSDLDADRTLWVISSDFNHVGPNFQHHPKHYGYGSGESMDMQAIDYITAGDIAGFEAFLKDTDATICGALPVLIAMHMLKKLGRREFSFKSYDCSGNQTGDSNSVGYASLYS